MSLRSGIVSLDHTGSAVGRGGLDTCALTSMRIELKTQAWSYSNAGFWEMSIQSLLRFCSLCFIRLRSRAKAFALLLFVAILLIAGISSIRKQTRVPMSKPWVGSPLSEIPHISPCSFFPQKRTLTSFAGYDPLPQQHRSSVDSESSFT
jgi:hypothetical protein